MSSWKSAHQTSRKVQKVSVVIPELGFCCPSQRGFLDWQQCWENPVFSLLCWRLRGMRWFCLFWSWRYKVRGNIFSFFRGFAAGSLGRRGFGCWSWLTSCKKAKSWSWFRFGGACTLREYKVDRILSFGHSLMEKGFLAAILELHFTSWAESRSLLSKSWVSSGESSDRICPRVSEVSVIRKQLVRYKRNNVYKIFMLWLAVLQSLRAVWAYSPTCNGSDW